MKQVTLTPELRARLQTAAGDGVDVSQHKVFEATALTTLPVRKDHPMYKGGRHTKKYLQQMAGQLNSESLPLQLVHNDSALPYGRIFYCDVLPIEGTDESELRSMFWVDPNESGVTNLINSGTVDQVSVSTLAKNACCSACGWDFMGPDGDIERVFSGICKNDHQIGVNGNHVVMDDLSQWFEMSLVGRGGATGARIHNANQSVLSMSGTAAPWLTLTLSDRDLEKTMTLEEMAAQLTALTASIATLQASVSKVTDGGTNKPAGTDKAADGSTAAPPPSASLPVDDPDANTNSPSMADLAAKIDDLVKAMTQITKAPAGDGDTPKAKTDDAGNFLLAGSPAAEFAKKILVMSGDVEAKLPVDPKAAMEHLAAKFEALLKANNIKSVTAEAASGSGGDAAAKPTSNSAFKSVPR